MIWEPYGPYVYLLIILPSIFVFFFSQDTFFAHFAKYLQRPTGTCEFTRNPGIRWEPIGWAEWDGKNVSLVGVQGRLLWICLFDAWKIWKNYEQSKNIFS